MSKTAETVLQEVQSEHAALWNELTFSIVDQAMHTYAEQRAVEFAEWLDKLPERELFTVHPPAGSGAGIGIYKKSLTDLYETFKERSDNQNS